MEGQNLILGGRKMECVFKLTRSAKSQGGDRYEHSVKGADDYMVFYIPQSISRKGGKIKDELKITIE